MPTHYRGTAKEEQALDTFIKLTRATDSLLGRLSRLGTQGNLTPTQFGVLESLLHLGTLCPGEISQKLLKSGGNTTLVVDNLEKRGLVKRVRDTQDRRMIKVSLTDSGRELIEELFPGHLEAIVDEMSVLTLDEQAKLGELCRKLGKKEAQPQP